MANLAGFLPLMVPLAELGFEPLMLDPFMLIADPGRINGTGLVAPGFEAGVSTDDAPLPVALGCCRIANTKVLLSASRWHCGCTT